MFLHLSVSHSVHRGSASVHAGIPPWADTPPLQTATVAGGMHPTGMHAYKNNHCSEGIRIANWQFEDNNNTKETKQTP